MFKKGFTLVELLIVIGLLGVIALIVIAAINPIEQANRARDTRMKADAGQLLSATERYFAVKGDFPWVVVGSADDNDVAYGFVNASDPSIGICGDANCTTDGELIGSYELKTEFKSRDFIKNQDEVAHALYVGKALGASASVYACYVPQSKSIRDKACENEIVYNLDTSAGTRMPKGCAAGADWPTNPDLGSGWFVCVPE